MFFSDNDEGKWEELAYFENEIPYYYLYQAENFLNLLEGKNNTLTGIRESAVNLEFLLKIKKTRKKGAR